MLGCGEDGEFIGGGGCEEVGGSTLSCEKQIPCRIFARIIKSKPAPFAERKSAKNAAPRTATAKDNGNSEARSRSKQKLLLIGSATRQSRNELGEFKLQGPR
jgi:hypothetical protein